MFDEILKQLGVVAVLVQRVLEFVKPLYEETKYAKRITVGLTLAISAAMCLAWDLNVFYVVGLPLPIWLGDVVTGIFAGLGAKVLNDVLTILEILKKKNQPKG